jgi:hypothetical protein
VVWAWLAQLGKDRAGFYSYDVLERAAGFGVRNVYRLDSAWQQDRAIGELVRAAPRDFMGGAFGPDFGWRVGVWQPGHLLALRATILDWAFELSPVDSQTTRLLVRIRSTNPPGLRTALLSNVDFAGFGLIHFIMERKLMVTVRDLSEETTRSRRAGRG